MSQKVVKFGSNAEWQDKDSKLVNTDANLVVATFIYTNDSPKIVFRDKDLTVQHYGWKRDRDWIEYMCVKKGLLQGDISGVDETQWSGFY